MFSWTTTVYLSIFPHQMEAIILCTVYAVKNSGKNEIPLCNHTFYQGLDIHLRTLVHCVHVSNFTFPMHLLQFHAVFAVLFQLTIGPVEAT